MSRTMKTTLNDQERFVVLGARIVRAAWRSNDVLNKETLAETRCVRPVSSRPPRTRTEDEAMNEPRGRVPGFDSIELEREHLEAGESFMLPHASYRQATWSEGEDTAMRAEMDQTSGWPNSPEAEELLERAWGIIANASGGDWAKGDAMLPGWGKAAEGWRDAYFEWISTHGREAVQPRLTSLQMRGDSPDDSLEHGAHRAAPLPDAESHPSIQRPQTDLGE